jgi:hypothetical protein
VSALSPPHPFLVLLDLLVGLGCGCW